MVSLSAAILLEEEDMRNAGTENGLFTAMSADEIFDVCMLKYYARIEENKKYYRGEHPTVYKAGDRVIHLSGIDEKKRDIEEYETVVVEAKTRDIMTGEEHFGTGSRGTYFIKSENGYFCQTQACMLRPATASGAISKESYAAGTLIKAERRRANESLRRGKLRVL
jgi:hypothetical protein